MPLPEEILARELHDRALDEQKRAAEKEELARAAAAKIAARLESLAGNEHWPWFLTEFFDREVAKEEADALNTDRSAHERDLSAHRRKFGLELRGLLDRKLAEYAARAKPPAEE